MTAPTSVLQVTTRTKAPLNRRLCADVRLVLRWPRAMVSPIGDGVAVHEAPRQREVRS